MKQTKLRIHVKHTYTKFFSSIISSSSIFYEVYSRALCIHTSFASIEWRYIEKMRYFRTHCCDNIFGSFSIGFRLLLYVMGFLERIKSKMEKKLCMPFDIETRKQHSQWRLLEIQNKAKESMMDRRNVFLKEIRLSFCVITYFNFVIYFSYDSLQPGLPWPMHERLLKICRVHNYISNALATVACALNSYMIKRNI